MSIPKNLSPNEFPIWLRQNAIETVSEETKVMFDQDQISEFKDRVVNCQKEVQRLEKIQTKVKDMITKGFETDKEEGSEIIEIPKTLGTKYLKNQIAIITEHLEKGYEIEIVQLHAIPDDETEEIAYYDIHGVEYQERRRKMSAREIHQYMGLFSKQNKNAS